MAKSRATKSNEVDALLAPAILGQPMKGNDDSGWAAKIGSHPFMLELGLYKAKSGVFVAHMNANGHAFQVCEGKTRRAAIVALEREIEKLGLLWDLVRAKTGTGLRGAKELTGV